MLCLLTIVFITWFHIRTLRDTRSINSPTETGAAFHTSRCSNRWLILSGTTTSTSEASCTTRPVWTTRT